MENDTNNSDDNSDVASYIYFYCTFIVSLLSLFGASITIGTYWYFEDMRSTGRTILTFISIADFLSALGNIIGVTWYVSKDGMTENGACILCKFQGTFNIFAYNASYCWNVAMAVYLFLMICLRKKLGRNKLIFVHIICWGFPCTISIAVISADVIGYDKNLTTPSWCWIDVTIDNPLLWQYLSDKLWQFLAIVLMLALYAAVKCTLWKQIRKGIRRIGIAPDSSQMTTHVKPRSRKMISNASIKLTFVPLIFILCRMWGTIRFMMGAHFSDKLQGGSATWLVLLQGIGDSAQGFTTCMFYVILSTQIRKRLLIYVCPLCCVHKLYNDVHIRTIDHTMTVAATRVSKHAPHALEMTRFESEQ